MTEVRRRAGRPRLYLRDEGKDMTPKKKGRPRMYNTDSERKQALSLMTSKSYYKRHGLDVNEVYSNKPRPTRGKFNRTKVSHELRMVYERAKSMDSQSIKDIIIKFNEVLSDFNVSTVSTEISSGESYSSSDGSSDSHE